MLEVSVGCLHSTIIDIDNARNTPTFSFLEQALDDMHTVFQQAKAEAGLPRTAILSVAEKPKSSPSAMAPATPTESLVAVRSPSSITGKSPFGLPLAYPARSAVEEIFVEDGTRSGIVGEDLGLIEFEWGERRNRGISGLSLSPQKWESNTSIKSSGSSFKRGRKLFRMLKEWVPGASFVTDAAAAPDQQHPSTASSTDDKQKGKS